MCSVDEQNTTEKPGWERSLDSLRNHAITLIVRTSPILGYHGLPGSDYCKQGNSSQNSRRCPRIDLVFSKAIIFEDGKNIVVPRYQARIPLVG